MPENESPYEHCGKCPMYCWLSKDEAMAYLGVGKTALYKYIELGLKVSKIIGKMRFLRSDLDDFIMGFRK
jgi:hypothetical protein